MAGDKYLYLVRGVSGSGKTTFVSNIIRKDDISVANDDFMIDGNDLFKFDWRKLEEVGIKCRESVKEAMVKNTGRIFVHNTFTTKKEMEPYFELAQKFGYNIQTIIIESRHKSKNIRGIPESTKDKQKKRFDIEL